MGLRGNHSFANLHRSTSGGSGIFIGEDSENEQDDVDSGAQKSGSGSWASTVGASSGYIKTSKMANFYYRKSVSHGEFTDVVGEDNTRDHQSTPSMIGK
jgi:hypothetical protein